jgi:hypothetical protein
MTKPILKNGCFRGTTFFWVDLYSIIVWLTVDFGVLLKKIVIWAELGVLE